MLTFAELWELCTSETAFRVYQLLGWLMGGSAGTLFAQRAWSAMIGHGEEVRRILRAIDKDCSLVPSRMLTPTGDKPGTVLSKATVQIDGTDIEIDPDAMTRGWLGFRPLKSGVIYQDKVDRTELYTSSELKAFLRATRRRLALMAEADRHAGRSVMADHVPTGKAKAKKT